MGIVYKVTNKINNKYYIGKTIQDFNRYIKRQISNTNINKQPNRAFYRAIRKYGSDNFEWSILWKGECSNEWLDELEKYYIYFYDSFGKNGYNMTEGGEGNINSGKYKRTNNIKEKLSKTLKGRIITKEWKENISKATKGKNNPMFGKCGNLSPMFGKKHSKKTKQKISLGNKGKKRTIEQNKINSINQSKWFIIENIKTKESFLIHGLKNFCKKYNLSYHSMKKISQGMMNIHKKEWTNVRRLEC